MSYSSIRRSGIARIIRLSISSIDFVKNSLQAPE